MSFDHDQQMLSAAREFVAEENAVPHKQQSPVGHQSAVLLQHARFTTIEQ
jgi:hypothetical protein